MHVSRNLSFTAWAYVKFVSTADAASTFVKKRLNEDGYLPLATEIKGITHIAAGVIYLSGVLYLECMTPDKQTEYTIPNGSLMVVQGDAEHIFLCPCVPIVQTGDD